MKKIGWALLVLGIITSGIALMADRVGWGQKGVLGAAQLLGIDLGVVLSLIGIGVMSIDFEWDFRTGLRKLPEQLLQISPKYWILSVFLVLYVLFFLFPVFFAKLKIQYFVKYIPYEWVSFIGNDIRWTIERIEEWLTLKQSPFSGFFYPPLTVFIFAPFMILGYPGYFKLITIITLFGYIIATLLIPIFVTPKKNTTLLLLFFVTGLFSYGLQFEMDRGQFNLIAFTACFLAIYLFHYHPKLRYFSYLLFTLAVQLKMYPIIFILMFVKDWRKWAENIKRLIGLLLLNISLVFVLGVQVGLDFLRNLTTAQLSFQSSRREDLSITGFVLNLTEDGFGVIPSSAVSKLAAHAGTIEILFLAIFALCLISILYYSYRKNNKGFNIYLLVICAIGALMIPSASVDYKLPLLIGPVAITLANLPSLRSHTKQAVLIFLLLVISFAYWSTLYPFTVKPYLISRNFPALFVLLLSVTFLFFLLKGETEINKTAT